MKKKLLSLVLALTVCLGLLTACGGGSDVITEAQAIEIALDAAGLEITAVDNVHNHPGDYQGAPCYNIHITAGDQEYTFSIHAVTGEILNRK